MCVYERERDIAVAVPPIVVDVVATDPSPPAVVVHVIAFVDVVVHTCVCVC